VSGIIAPFFAWRYFLNQTKRILSNEYEIEDECLIIYELGQRKKTIQFRNIIKFEKASLGFKIYSYQSEPSFIFYGIENEEELINIVQNKILFNKNQNLCKNINNSPKTVSLPYPIFTQYQK
jgi:hypothetical protein